MPTFGAASLLLPSAEARRRARELKRALIASSGPMTLRERLTQPAATALGLFTEATTKLGVLQQPGLLRVAHRCDGEAGARSGPIMALQGAGTSLLGRLAEDARHLVIDRFRKPNAEHAEHAIEWGPIPSDRRSLDVLQPSQPADEIGCAAQ